MEKSEQERETGKEWMGKNAWERVSEKNDFEIVNKEEWTGKSEYGREK